LAAVLYIEGFFQPDKLNRRGDYSMRKFSVQKKKFHCPSCGNYHDLTATYDRTGKTRAWFCNNTKDIAVLVSTTWNGLDIEHLLKQYIPFVVDTANIDRLSESSLSKLAFKVAIYFKEYTVYGYHHDINIYFAKKIAYKLLLTYKHTGKATAKADDKPSAAAN
jgi:hypothetical protein